MFSRMIALVSLVAVAVILAMMNFTTPTEVGPLGVLVFLIMVYLAIFGVATLIVKIFSKVMGKKRLVRKDYLYAAVITFGPIMLLLAQSFGSLSLWTVALTAVFVCLACFLVNKRL